MSNLCVSERRPNSHFCVVGDEVEEGVDRMDEWEGGRPGTVKKEDNGWFAVRVQPILDTPAYIQYMVDFDSDKSSF